jgi:hypothetical protein
MKIEVTQKDIDKGIPRDAAKCPIAKALQRQCPKRGRKWLVNCAEAEAMNKKDPVDSIDYPLPKKCMRFIDDFDKERTVKPFTFELKEPK